jgi:hypothetical protein
VFDLPHPEAADLCQITENGYRQRLSRARRALEAFTESYCGLVADRAPCRCDKRLARAEELGRVERGHPRLATLRVSEAKHEMESLYTAAQLMRSHPAYAAPTDALEGVRAALQCGLRLLE